MGAEISPPGIDQVARYRMSENMIDPAIELMKVNEVYSPNSFVMHQSLGDAFRAKGNATMAKKYYKEVLRLSPRNERVELALKELVR